MKIQNWSLCIIAITFFSTHPLIAAKEDERAHDEENRIHLNKEQRLSAGIVVEPLSLRAIPTEIEAHGEIRRKTYASSMVTPRIEAQVVKRHARLGDHVSMGQPLITLSSVSMAEAQGELLVAAKEWQRVKNLGEKVVSERRYLEAQVTFQQAQAKLLAYGLTDKQTNRLIEKGGIAQADGRFTLLAPQDGTVINDDFITGQMLEPGDLLFALTDESRLWVEVRVNPRFVSQIHEGMPASVLADGEWIAGKVIQVHHNLDKITRTLAVRLEIPNPHDQLHPGQFITAKIQTSKSVGTALALPLEAVLRSPDGDWQVFVEDADGVFEPKEIEVVRELPGLAIIKGLMPGSRVVTHGAFFVQSELAKSGFDAHSH